MGHCNLVQVRLIMMETLVSCLVGAEGDKYSKRKYFIFMCLGSSIVFPKDITCNIRVVESPILVFVLFLYPLED